MTQGDGAPVHVQLVPLDAEVAGGGDHLGGEGLVDLDQVDVVDRHAGALEGLADGLDRAEAHDLGVEPGHAARHDACKWGDPELGCLGVAHDDHGRGTVVQGTGVARRDGAALTEHGLQLREPLERGARAGPVVLGHHGPVGERHRDDLSLEEAVVLRTHGPGLRQQGELVLLLAAHALELGHVLGGLAHGDVDVGQAPLGAPRLGERRRAGGGARLGLSEEGVVGAGVRCTVHVAADRLDTGSHEDVTLARPDGVGGHADRLQRRGAVAVDRDTGDVVEPGEQGDDARHVVARLTAGLAAAEDEVLDVVRVELGELGQHDLDRQGGEVVGTALDERALHGTADGGAAGGDDDCFGHGVLL